MTSNPIWFILIALGAAALLGVIVLFVIIRRQDKAIEARPPYPCLTFYLQRQEDEDRARARENLGAILDEAPRTSSGGFRRILASLKNSEKIKKS